MTTKCYSMVRGRVARFTRLDARGVPIESDYSTIITRGLTSIVVDEITDSVGDNLMRTDYDEPRILMKGKTTTIRYGVTINLKGVDPDLTWFLTGQDRITNAAGVFVGNDVQTKKAPSNFAIEVWTRLAVPQGHDLYGYTVFPRVRGGLASGFTFSNNSVSFSVKGAKTYRNSRWGYGPYDIVIENEPNCLIVPDAPSPDDLGFGLMPFGEFAFGGKRLDLPTEPPRQVTPIGRNVHWRQMLLPNAPEPMCGAQPLYDVIDGGSAAFTTSDFIDGQRADTTSLDVVDGGAA